MPAGDAAKWTLYRAALGLCSMPQCRQDLTYYATQPLHGGQAAHIRGEKPGTARHDSAYGPVNEYENLILLCPNHHDEIDTDRDRWTVPALEAMKSEHEAFCRFLKETGSTVWRERFLTVDYLNLPRLLALPGAKAIRDRFVNSDGMPYQSLRGLGLGVAEVLSVCKPIITAWDTKAVDLGTTALDDDMQPSLVSWTSVTAYTKNGRYPETWDRPLTGDLRRDPHVYMKLHGSKVAVRYDPAWITTSTAFVNLSSGRMRSSGLGILLDTGPGKALVSALVLGKHMNPEAAWFYDH